MHPLAFINNLAGAPGWIILLIILIFVGGKRLPDLGKSIGQSMREFQKGKEGKEEDEKKPKA